MSILSNLHFRWPISRRKEVKKEGGSDGKLSIKQMMKEFGVRTEAGTIGTYTEEENPDNLSISNYIQMQDNDGTVKGITRLFVMPIQSTDIKIIPHQDDSGEAEFIKTVLMSPEHKGGMTTPLSFVIADMTRAIMEGFRVFEKVPRVIEEGEYKGKIGWKKLAPRDAETISINTDDQGGFDGVTQVAYFKDKAINVKIPAEKCMLFTFQKERHPYYGESILKTAHYHYDKKHKLYYLAHKKAETDAVGLKILKLLDRNRGGDEVSQAERAVDETIANSRLTLPQGFDLDIDRSPGGYDVMPLIDHHDTQIALSTLTQAMSMGQKSTYNYPYGGGYGFQGKFITQMLDSVMRSIEDTLNQWAIAPLIEWNFGTKAYPKVQMMPLEEETEEYLMKIFEEILKGGGENISPEMRDQVVNEVAEKLGIEMKEKSIQEAMNAFENGKRGVFDTGGHPASPTTNDVKKQIKEKAKQLKRDPRFLERFEAMGKEYANSIIINQKG